MNLHDFLLKEIIIFYFHLKRVVRTGEMNNKDEKNYKTVDGEDVLDTAPYTPTHYTTNHGDPTAGTRNAVSILTSYNFDTQNYLGVKITL